MFEIKWNTTNNSDSADYICSKCLDLQCHERHRAIFLTLFRQLYKALPQLCATYIYDFIYIYIYIYIQHTTANGTDLTGTITRSAGWQCNSSWMARRAPTTTSTTYINNCSSKVHASYFGKANDTAPAAGVSTLIYMSFSATILFNRTCKGVIPLNGNTRKTRRPSLAVACWIECACWHCAMLRDGEAWS